jgi:hypothetical protein
VFTVPRKAWRPTCRLLLLAGALVVSAAAHAAPVCSDLPYAIDETKYTLGPKHHPMGRPLPATEGFNQPDACSGAIRFFDQNRNGEADPGEVRVFGSLRQVDCGSCHGEGADALSPPTAALFLRQNAASLCLVCHRI